MGEHRILTGDRMNTYERQVEYIKERLREELKPSRFAHTLRVADTARHLAHCHGLNEEQAYLAGLLHDCAKCIDKDRQKELCEAYGVALTPFEQAHPGLIHAKLGAVLAGAWYDVKDPAIAEAIRWHTTGKPAMEPLTAVIYAADYIEPGRTKAQNLDALRALGDKDLYACVTAILANMMAYLDKDPENTDPMTAETYHYYTSRNT